MNITEEKTDELSAVLKIKVEKTDYSKNVDKILRDYRKKTDMPGFRPGMVPIGMIKKMYGKYVMAYEINKLLHNSLYDYIEKNKIDILGDPIPKENGSHIDFETQEEFEFSYEVGLAPQFSVNISPKQKFTKYFIIASQKLIDKEIDFLTKKYGTFSYPEISGENDTLSGEFTELNESGNAKEHGIKLSGDIYIKKVPDEKTKKSLIGLSKGDTVSVELKKLFSSTVEISSALKIGLKTAENLKSNFEFKITFVYNVVPAEINKEFLDKLYGEDSVKTVEEFRAKVAEKLKKDFEADSEWKLMQDIKEHYLEKLSLKLPDEFLKKWLKAVNKEITEEQIEKEYDLYAKDLRWRLIERKIIDENNIKVTREEVKERIKRELKKIFTYYGLADRTEEEWDQLAEDELKIEKTAYEQTEAAYKEKLETLFKNTFTIKTKKVSFDEFIELLQKKPKSGLLSRLKNLIGKQVVRTMNILNREKFKYWQ